MDPKLACEWQVEICFLASGRLELLAPVPDRGVLNIWDFGRQINRGSWKCARVRVCTKGYKPTLLFLLSKEPVYQHTLANFPVGNIYERFDIFQRVLGCQCHRTFHADEWIC